MHGALCREERVTGGKNSLEQYVSAIFFTSSRQYPISFLMLARNQDRKMGIGTSGKGADDFPYINFIFQVLKRRKRFTNQTWFKLFVCELLSFEHARAETHGSIHSLCMVKATLHITILMFSRAANLEVC